MSNKFDAPQQLPDSDTQAKGGSRRQFLGQLGCVTVAVAAAASTPAAEAVEVAPQDEKARANTNRILRNNATRAERQATVRDHPCNEDEVRFPNFIANFTKGLPHDDLGVVDPAAYNALKSALQSGSFQAIENLTLGGTSRLLNPLGGLAFNIEGPDSPNSDVGIAPTESSTIVAPLPPAFDSLEQAAEIAEIYWMAVLRDVPFADYATNPLVQQAADDLDRFGDAYKGPRDPVSGRVTPRTIFRDKFPGCIDGPLVSQFLLQPYVLDGVTVTQRIRTSAPGAAFLTLFEEWLAAQRGFPTGSGINTPTGFKPFPSPNQFDPEARYRFNLRALGQTVAQDTINSLYFAAVLFLQGNGLPVNPNNPYRSATKQGGFATFGSANLITLLGSVVKSERHTWYQKWNVQRRARPEVYGGRVHSVLAGLASYPLHPDLFDSPVFALIFEANRQANLARFGLDVGTYLLPIIIPSGSPFHPSFPAGHAISAGACVALLKAWFDETAPFPNPVKPSADGLSLEPYVVGVDGPALTVGGELNKLCSNGSLGRDMSGVHWRTDDLTGNLQGEFVTFRILKEAGAGLPEPFAGFRFTGYDGVTRTVGGNQ